MRSKLAFVAGALILFFVLTFIGADLAQAYYYPPSNTPPGPPPNYNQVDTSLFRGEPVLPMPPPDSGGFYIWVDEFGAWNIANHLYVKGTNLEHFHGSVLATMSTQPTPGVNVFATNFELHENTEPSLCYRQNDRWGWYQWDEDLYEIWWDVSTRQFSGEGDPNDFMKIVILGCAIDFNVWSSGHGGHPFGPDQVYLGSGSRRLCDVPGYTDTYPSVYDPYQSQIDFGGRNITIFSPVSGSGSSYNVDGLVIPGQTYPCGDILGQTYGGRFNGAFVYEGNGVQFSSSCVYDPCQSNTAPALLGPFDRIISQCSPVQYCFDVDYNDYENNFLRFDLLSGPGTIHGRSGEVCFTPGPSSSTYIFEVMATDSCGRADTAIYSVNVNINRPPFATCPGEVSFASCEINLLVCDLSPIYLPGFQYGDPDGNLASVSISGGTLHGDSVSFTPVVGYNNIRLVVVDSCGAVDTCKTQVNIILNTPPNAVSPANEDRFACDLSQIRLPGFSASDPDDNLVSLTLSGGTLHGDTAVFTPVAGANTLRLIAVDECGRADTSVTVFTVNLNHAPDAVTPSDQSRFACDLSPIRLPGFTATDIDNNLVSKTLTGGTLSGDTAVFTPVAGANTLRLIATDACGRADTAITVVTVTINHAPIATSPADQSMFVCDLSQIRLPGFAATDVDNNIVSRILQGGSLSGDTALFVPVVGSNTLRFIATDACGLADTSVTVVSVGLNRPPDAVSPANQNLFICDLSQVRLPGFTASDPDGNLISKILQGGTLAGDTAICTPVAGPNTLRLIATDACGRADTSITMVTVSVNHAPVTASPANQPMFVCDLSEIRLPGFTASDIDNNFVSRVLQGGTLHGDTAYFIPIPGANTLRLIATDACGAADTNITVVTINNNRPPEAFSPSNQNMFVCDLSEIRLPGFTASDPDNNLVSKVLSGGILRGDTACFVPAPGANTLRLIATDACGRADTATTIVTIGNNRPPVVASPVDQNMFVCNLSEIRLPGFTASDPDGNLVSRVLLGGTLHGDTAYFTPAVGANVLRLIATDACGAADTSLTTITIDLNQAPVAVSPADEAGFVCDLSQICLPGFTATDSDGNIVSRIVQGGTLDGETVCFTPVAGPNTLRFIVADACGAADTSVTVVTVTVNHSPVASSPSDQNRFACDLSPIRLPGFTATDIDNNLVSKTLLGGILSGDTAVFTPVAGPNTLKLIATDACGAADTSITVVTVSLNHAPVASSPSDQSMFVCDLSHIRLAGFTASDIDGNLVSKILIGGTLSGDTALFVPVVGANTLRLIATDACGLSDTSTTVVTIALNRAPVASSPTDQNMFVCDLSQVCLPGFVASDIDNNLVSRIISGGVLHGDTACFTPVAGPNTLRFIATDACGLADTSITIVTIAVNRAPIASSPAGQALFVCDLSEICMPGFTANDPDGNLVSRVLQGGTLNGDTACFTPVAGPNTLRLIATDACGVADTSVTVVTISVNHAPVAVSPADAPRFVCDLSQICIPGFTASDIDNNLASRVLLGGTLSGDTACFTPVAGVNTLRLIATDACGAVDTATTVIAVTVNAAPVAASPADTSFVVADLAPICLRGFTASDPDGNLVSRVVLGGTLSGDTACFTPVQGLNTMTFIVTDACGAADTSITRVTVNMRISLSLVGGTAPEFTEEIVDSVLISITGGDPSTLTFVPDFTAHDGNPARFATSFNGSIHKTNVTFDYLGEFSSAGTPFAYRVVASDAYSADTLDLSLVVLDNNRAPAVGALRDTTIFVGSTLSLAITGNDSDLDNTLTLTKVSGPGTFVSTPSLPPVAGTLGWTPTIGNIGSHQAIFSVSDGRGGSDLDTVVINVAPTGIALAVVGGTPPVFTEEMPDLFFVSLGGYDPASLTFATSFVGHSGAPSRYQSSLAGNAIRVSSTFDFLGEFSIVGSPFGLRVIASDNFSADTLVVSLVVNDANRSPELAVGSNYTVTVDHPLTFGVSATDIDTDNTLTLTKLSGPGTFAGATGPSPVSANFIWTPTDADLPGSPHTVIFAVGDGRDGLDTARVTITLYPDGEPQIQILYTPLVFREGQIDSFVIAAIDPDGDPLGGFEYAFQSPAPGPTFPGASMRVHNDTAFLRLTFDYLGPWSSSGAPFPLRFIAYSMLSVTDTATLNIQVQVLNTNRKPDLQVSGPHAVSAGENLTLNLLATDLDTEDHLTLSGANLPPASVLTDNGNGAGALNWATVISDTGSYVFRFFASDNSGPLNSMDTVLWNLQVTAPDTGGPGGIALDMGCPTALPGTDVLVPVYLHTPDIYTGGIELLIGWDSTVLTLLDAIPTARLNDGDEFFNLNRNAAGPGTVRIVWIANLNNGIYTPPMPPGEDVILWLNFHVASGGHLFGMNIPIDFVVHHYSDNTISDSTGYQLIWPLLSSGCVNIEDPDEFRGDPNMNGLFYEIADAVLVARRLIEGYSVWVINPPVQEASADLNENGFVDVADLVWFINIINDYIDPPKLDHATGFGVISMPGEITPEMEIKITSSSDVGGALVRINHGCLEIGEPVPANGMQVQSSDEGGILSVIVYSLSCNRIPAGEQVLFTLPVAGSGAMSFAEVQASDAFGRLLDMTSRIDVALPTETELSPNYPNPFNPATTLKFSLADGGEVQLAVYDITGRQVRGLVAGRLDAGYYEVAWDGRSDAGEPVTSGIYFARMKHGAFEKTVKMSLLK